MRFRIALWIWSFISIMTLVILAAFASEWLRQQYPTVHVLVAICLGFGMPLGYILSRKG